MRRLVVAAAVLAAALLAAGCSALRPAADPVGGPAVVFLYDNSTSVPDRLLLTARELTRRRLQAPAPGRWLVIRSVGGEGTDEGWTWRPLDEPSGGEPVEPPPEVREAVVASTDTSRPGRRVGSDLVAALERVGRSLGAPPDARSVLYVFSDMLQVGSGLNFEVPGFESPRGWLSDRSAAGRLPALEGVCVVVVGPEDDTRRDRRVRAFWEAFFRAAGARLRPENYTSRLSELPVDPCFSDAPTSRGPSHAG